MLNLKEFKISRVTKTQNVLGGASEVVANASNCDTYGGCSDDTDGFTEQWTDDADGHETSYKTDKM